MKNMITAMIVVVATAATICAMTGTQEERLDALEYCSRITHDNLVDYQALDQQTKLLLSEDSVRQR